MDIPVTAPYSERHRKQTTNFSPTALSLALCLERGQMDEGLRTPGNSASVLSQPFRYLAIIVRLPLRSGNTETDYATDRDRYPLGVVMVIGHRTTEIIRSRREGEEAETERTR